MSVYSIDYSEPLKVGFEIPAGGYDGPGAASSHTSLRLHGRGALEWGEAVNEDLVRLTETFASASPPINPTTGQMWAEIKLYNRYGGITKRYNATTKAWTTITAPSQPTPPTNPVVGQYYFNSTTNILYGYYSVSTVRQHEYGWRPRSYSTKSSVTTGTPPEQTVKVYNSEIDAVDKWIIPQAVTVSTTAPIEPPIGTLWFDITTNTLKVWDGTTWQSLVPPETPSSSVLDMNGYRIIEVGNATADTDALNRITGDGRYVNVSGDAMTGPLTLHADPTTNLGAVTKQYVDNKYVLLAGDVMTGRLTLSADPISNLHAVTKQYLDARVPFGILALGTILTSTVTLDFSASRNFSMTLGTNTQLLLPTNVVAGQSGVIRVIQDATGGRLMTFASNWKFESGTDPVLTVTGGASDVLAYYALTSTTIMISFYKDVK